METKTPELTIGQRLAADTPVFFKKIELIGLALLALGGSLTQIQGLPLYLAPIILGIGTSFTLLSKFAVKDTSVLANPNATIEDYAKVLSDIPNQIKELHEGIQNTVAAIKTGEVKPEVPVQETPIVEKSVTIVTEPNPNLVTGIDRLGQTSAISAISEDIASEASKAVYAQSVNSSLVQP